MTSQEANTPPLPLIPITECPACHSKAWRAVTLGAAPLKRCTDCGLTYAPEYTDPDAIYLDGYFSGELGPFGVDTSHPDFRKFLTFVGKRRMDILERVVRAPGRIVDVGCGTGETLAEAKRRGWETYGVDLIADAVQVAIDDFGIDARQSLLEESGLPERSFDVVSATHVLEHMPDGAGFLAPWPAGSNRARAPLHRGPELEQRRTAWAMPRDGSATVLSSTWPTTPPRRWRAPCNGWASSPWRSRRPVTSSSSRPSPRRCTISGWIGSHPDCAADP